MPIEKAEIKVTSFCLIYSTVGILKQTNIIKLIQWSCVYAISLFSPFAIIASPDASVSRERSMRFKKTENLNIK
jgi:Na+(H+)/acetate symporter ActP